MSLQAKTDALFDGRSLKIFSALVILSAVILGWVGWNIYSSFEADERLDAQTRRIFSLKGIIVHHDEAMTTAAQMAAATGDLAWEKRYRQLEPELNSALEEAVQLLHSEQRSTIEKSRDANIKLIEMENLGFDLVREGKAEKAKRVVFGEEYRKQKDLYQIGTTDLTNRLNSLTEVHRKVEAKRLYYEAATILVALLIVFFGWGTAFLLLQRQTLEKQLRQSQKLEAVGVLAGGVAHEFNNILTAVTVSAGFLKEGIAPQDPLQEDVQEILKAGSRAAVLTQQLLNFSQKQFFEPKVLGMNDLLGGFEVTLRHVLGEHIALLTSLAPDLWPVKGDETSIEQVFVTLARNARDAMPHGGHFKISTENVNLTKGAVGPYVQITVSDTGKGIEPSVMPRLFEPFFTTKGRVKGTGLGLASVYGIIKQNGGFIEIESEPDHGATFKIYLPAAANC